jgi:glucose-1-phosphate adenylyltransferase
MINQGCVIEGNVEHSVIFGDVKIGKNTTIKNSVVLPGVEIGNNVFIENVIINNNVKISDDKKINKGKKSIALISENM